MATYSLPLIAKLQPDCLVLDHFDDAFPPISCTMDVDSFVKSAKQYFPDIKIIQPQEAEFFEI